MLSLTLMPGATLFPIRVSLGAVGSLLWLLWRRVGLLSKTTTVFLLLCSPICAQGQSITVTLLGTGSPVPNLERFGPSILVQAGSQVLLVDCGRGAVQRLFQLGMLKEVHSLFLTHLHADHVVGIPDLWQTGWLIGRRDVSLQIWGPKGTADMISHLEKAYQFDIGIRLQYANTPPPRGVVTDTEEITQGVVYQQQGVKITAFDVDHGQIKPAFGYRIDYGDRSVVLSGDTRYSENLIRFSKGVDLLVHEVVAAAEFEVLPGYPPARIREIQSHHTTPEQAGEVFSRVRPRLAVYSHIVPTTAAASGLIASTRKTYAGPLEVGEDLMTIEVGEQIVVRRH